MYSFYIKLPYKCIQFHAKERKGGFSNKNKLIQTMTFFRHNPSWNYFSKYDNIAVPYLSPTTTPLFLFLLLNLRMYGDFIQYEYNEPYINVVIRSILIFLARRICPFYRANIVRVLSPETNAKCRLKTLFLYLLAKRQCYVLPFCNIHS